MTGPDDDLTPWHDDPVVRALREPGTSHELADESAYLAAFRAAQPPAQPTPPPTPPTDISAGRLGRMGRRLGGGGSAVVVAVALGAGAAAAYTQNLPEPVQRAVHGVFGPVGVPAPETPEPEKGTGDPEAGDGETAPPASPTSTPDETPTSSPSPSPSESPSDTPSESPSESPSPTSSESPTSSPTTPPALPAASVALVGTSNRVGPDQQVPLTATVTAADGTAVPDEQVVLQQRIDGTWQPVATATSDASGAVSVATPALARTSVFRFGVGDTVTSERWRVVLVPDLDLAVEPSSAGTGIAVTARGALPGDRVALFRKRPGGPVLVARARLSESLSTTFRVAAPSRRVGFVARLPRTRAHAPARESVRVLPLKPQSMSAVVPVDVLGPSDQVTVSGTVSGPDGVALPGRTVRLLMRAADGQWRRVGTAVSDPSGSVAIRVGPIDRNAAVRLRVGAVRSPVVRLRLQPVWTTSVTPGSDSTVVTGTVAGGNAGDAVLLRTMVDGRLVTVQQGSIGPAGVVRFAVQPPEKRPVRYRLVLSRTPLHLLSKTTVIVRPAPS